MNKRNYSPFTNRHTVGKMTMKWTRRILGHSLVRFLVCSIRSFACSTLLALLARSAALIRSLARALTRSRDHGKAVFIHDMKASNSYIFHPSWVPRTDRPLIAWKSLTWKFTTSASEICSRPQQHPVAPKPRTRLESENIPKMGLTCR